MSKFHVGDMVRVKKGLTFKETGILHVEEEYCGKTFRVSKVLGSDDADISLELDGCGDWSFSPYWLEPLVVGKERIFIIQDGKTVTAMLFNGKKKIREGKAKCHPDDPFDFVTGAKLALERLAGGEEKKPEYKAGDFVMVTGGSVNHHFPIGSVVKLESNRSGKYWLASGISPWLGGVTTRAITVDDFEPYKEERE